MEYSLKIPSNKGLKMLRQRRDAVGYDKMLGSFYQSQQLWDIYYRMQGDDHEQKNL